MASFAVALSTPSGKAQAPSLSLSRRAVLSLLALSLAVPVALYALLAYSPLATSSAVYPADMASATKALIVVVRRARLPAPR